MSNASTSPAFPRPTGLENPAPLAAAEPLGYGVAAVRLDAIGLDRGARLEVLWPEARLDEDEAAEPVDDPELVLPPEHPWPKGRGADAPEALAGLAWDGSSFGIRALFPPGTSFYGTGARAGPLERSGVHALCWNTDAFGYGPHTPALYQSQPAVLAVEPDGRSTYVVALTARRTRISVASDGFELQVAGAPCAIARITGPDPAAAVAGLSALVGRPAAVPRWALGYHQCRWSYMSEAEVQDLVDRFDTHELPLAAVWLDIDYMDRFRVFTWDRAAFPDLPGLVRGLAAREVRTVAILDPGLAVDDPAAAEAKAGAHLVQDSRGRPVEGRVWPGRCHFPDFTRDETRAWWAGRVRRLVDETGLSGLWCDMNEPAVFSNPTLTLPEDAVHRGLGGGSHARFHNLYGQLMVEATRDGLAAARPGEAPFVLTRAAHLRTPMSAATWTGDNLSRWEDLKWSVTMVLGLGLVGQAMAGPDVGGFVGDPGPELFARWFELGCYLPFFRGHSEKHSPRKEPWSYGEATLGRVRAALRWRSRLLPYLEACLGRARQEGLPAMRPLFFAGPEDPRLRRVEGAFLLGEDLLVVPALEPGHPTVELPLPPGRWRRVPVDELVDEQELETSRERPLDGPLEAGALKIEVGPGPAPCFLREGARLPLAPVTLRPPPGPSWPVLETLVG